MSFIARDVKDRVVQYPHRYQLIEVSTGIFDLVPVTGTVVEPGTAINKAYLQPIEDSLEEALEKTDFVTGSYTGDGTDDRLIDLGFTPRVVDIAWYLNSFYNAAFSVTADMPFTYGSGTIVEIVTNGFKVHQSDTTDFMNKLNAKYRYIAYK